MKKEIINRIFAITLSAVMCVGALPHTVFADTDDSICIESSEEQQVTEDNLISETADETAENQLESCISAIVPETTETDESEQIVSEEVVDEVTSPACETQSRDYNFNKNFTLSSDQAQNIVNVAYAQEGKTQANLGYTEAWCADFVCDCARLTGMSDSIIPYNYSGRGSCTLLIDYMLDNCGATKVDSRQKGDLVFYYCNSCKSYVHVGIVVDSQYSLEGNYSSKVTKVAGSYRDGDGHTLSSGTIRRVYVRPKYENVTPPTWSSISIDKSVYALNETVRFTFYSDTATGYTIGINDAAGNRIKTVVVKEAYYETSFQSAGEYNCYVTAYNSAGYHDSATISFKVYDTPPTISNISMTKQNWPIGETVRFDFYSDLATGYVIGINDVAGNRIKTVDVKEAYYETSFQSAGEYNCYVTAYNSIGYIDSSTIYFKVIDIQNNPVNLGSEFIATIYSQSGTCLDRNVTDRNVTGFAAHGGANQRWYFQRQTDGSYKISSAENLEYCLDVQNGLSDPNTNVETVVDNGSSAQRWFIYSAGDGYYYLRPGCASTAVLDLTYGSPADGTNVIIYPFHGGQPQKWSFDTNLFGAVENIGEDFTATIKNAESNTVVSSDCEKNDAGGFQYTDSSNQKWHFKRQADGSYKIITKEDDYKCLDVRDGASGCFTKVGVAWDNGSSAQRWFIYPAGNGRHYLRPACSNSCVLDLRGGYSEDNTLIWTHVFNSCAAQQWIIETVNEQVTPNFTIIDQPSNTSAGINGKATFSVTAENAASYQWQYSKNGGAKWINCSAAGNTTDTLTVTVTKSNSVNIYRCVVTGTDGNQLISNTATVDLLPGAVITLNPKSNAVAIGEYATFTVEAENAAGFQWQYSKDGANWYRSNAEGNQTDTLIVKGEQKSQGNRYRCVVTGIDGNTKKSYMAAMIVMTVAPKDCTAAVGQMASYTLKAEGIAAYQWQYSKDGGQTWYKSSAEGATTDTVTFKASTSNRAMIYRCKLTTPDEATAYTKPVGFK